MTDAVIVRVSVGQPAPLTFDQQTAVTGIVKHPVDGPVEVSELNLAGDGQEDLTDHGGRDKAIYAYTVSGYEYWARELNVDQLETSQFGENLEISGISDQDVLIGSRYRVGTVEVLVTQPRIPCFKLGLRMRDKTFPNRFLQSGRLGFYLRVVTPGQLQAGDQFTLIDAPAHGITVHGLWRIVFGEQASPDDVKRAISELKYLDEGWLRRLRVIAARHE